MKNPYRRQKATGLVKYFWAAELLSLVLLVAAGKLPILDCSTRESFAYMKEPSQRSLDAYVRSKAKKQELVGCTLLGLRR
jgi:hypothetical protein